MKTQAKIISSSVASVALAALLGASFIFAVPATQVRQYEPEKTAATVETNSIASLQSLDTSTIQIEASADQATDTINEAPTNEQVTIQPQGNTVRETQTTATATSVNVSTPAQATQAPSATIANTSQTTPQAAPQSVPTTENLETQYGITSGKIGDKVIYVDSEKYTLVSATPSDGKTCYIYESEPVSGDGWDLGTAELIICL